MTADAFAGAAAGLITGRGLVCGPTGGENCRSNYCRAVRLKIARGNSFAAVASKQGQRVFRLCCGSGSGGGAKS